MFGSGTAPSNRLKYHKPSILPMRVRLVWPKVSTFGKVALYQLLQSRNGVDLVVQVREIGRDGALNTV